MSMTTIRRMVLGLWIAAISACAAQVGTAEDADSAAEVELQAEPLLGGGPCCITYWCETDPDVETMGCKMGPGGSIWQAHRACVDACEGYCRSSGLICE